MSVLTNHDAREAIARLAEHESLPLPQLVTLGATGVMVQVADRDQVDEWAEMLGAVPVRWGDWYGIGWQKRVACPGTSVAVSVFCAVPPIQWQPRAEARS
jgi:hypothetical protein